MYVTKIKEKYHNNFKSYWWSEGDKKFTPDGQDALDLEKDEYVAVLTMDNMTLLYNPGSGSDLLLDIYNNKIEPFKVINPEDVPTIIVEAKNVEIRDKQAIFGLYKIDGWEVGEKNALLHLVPHYSPGEVDKGRKGRRVVLPSKLRVVNVIANGSA